MDNFDIRRKCKEDPEFESALKRQYYAYYKQHEPWRQESSPKKLEIPKKKADSLTVEIPQELLNRFNHLTFNEKYGNEEAKKLAFEEYVTSLKNKIFTEETK